MSDPGSSTWIVAPDAAGYPSTPDTRYQIAPAGDAVTHEFCAALLDLGARIGLESRTLPADVFTTAAADDTVVLRTTADLRALAAEPAGEPWDAVSPQSAVSACLTDFFGIHGALEDRDGDLLPDASRIAIELPETLPVDLAVALANLAARIGLESGGISFPLVRAGGARFRVQPSAGEAELRALDDGWVLRGAAPEMAALLREVSATWPHLGRPGLPGVEDGIGRLRRGLAGIGPEPGAPGELLWELQWSVRWEAELLLDLARTEVLPSLAAGPAELILFSGSDPEARRQIAAALRGDLDAAGRTDVRVTVLAAFKAGLSWLREVVLPEAALLSPSRVRIGYRRHTSEGEHPALDLPIRWAQELFPGPEILARDLGLPLEAIDVVEMPADADDIWTATALADNGGVLGHWTCTPPALVQPWVPQFPQAGTVRVTTGGIVVEQAGARCAYPLPTDLERFWSFWQHDVMPRVFEEVSRSGGLAGQQPFFGALEAEVWISAPNERLGIREENDSAAEALHEEIYFGTLDSIEIFGQQTSGERLTAPGAVVPIVRVTPGAAPRAQVRLRAAPQRPVLPAAHVRVAALGLAADGRLQATVEAEVDGEVDASIARLRELADIWHAGDGCPALVHLGDARVRLILPRAQPLPAAPPPAAPPPMDANIHGAALTDWLARLATLPGVEAWVEDVSWEGRPVPAVRISSAAGGGGSATKDALLKPTYLIVARHHANEISSTNAALQLIWRCATDPAWRIYLEQVNILLLPYENPDGAALHARLAADPAARHWKHHPARYNALGYEFGFDHLNPDSPFGEARARGAVWRRFPADVVVDNHGVPSHEWVQPFAGFGSPPRFRVSYWIVQALLYGIASVIDDPAFPHSRATVNALRDAVSARVRDTDIGDWNRVYGASYRFWGQSREPEHFPGVFYDDMLWHISTTTPDPDGRNLEQRYPRTTAISWVTEVNDETADGEHLERVARAHLLANQATLDLLAAAATPPRRWRAEDGPGRYTLRIGRERPLRLDGISGECRGACSAE